MIYAHVVLSLATIAVFAILIKIRLRSRINYYFPGLFPCKKPVFLPIAVLNHVPCTEKNEDLISQLSDDILILIISRLSTRDATRTSLLARRWRNLYRYVTEIELSCYDLLERAPGISRSFRPKSSDSVMNALDSFLRLRSGSKIPSFRLTACSNKSATDRFEQCISILGRMDVESFFLEGCRHSYLLDLSFSCHLFSKMPLLKKIELSNCYLQSSLRSQCNNSIQNLVLMDVSVSPGAIESVLSNCLKLHSLMMTGCACPSKLSFCGPHLELKSLYIMECEGVKEIEFYASNLVIFEFTNPVQVDFIFDHVPQLQSTYIYIFEKNIFPYVCGKLAVDLPDLKSLNFATRGDNFQESRINMFGNLRRLYINVYSLPKIHLLWLTSFLHSCPLLQEFHLTMNICVHGPLVEKEKQAVVFHSELKKMEIGGFRGTEYEMEFALYILKSAISLEIMNINRCPKVYSGPDNWRWEYVHSWSENTRARIQTELQGQAVSKTAQLTVQHEPDDPLHSGPSCSLCDACCVQRLI
ncbi:hypothetical protein ABFS82_03G115900 [Erythranthe guttata]|nr:PREDICTED: F-box/FBD/LRR-repeat protein At4g26340-like isoform X1 [Erythranthe guttata]XP_012854839.1 PREDICTED: F-box/FBD/LRR-repeat protein At4g26340-like isoform X1 [Erythranthe guttata]|eukprot:XP_012854838.1 PREDICTED: F-box/FBD/LRR-repeat protein At4g26340-like isoform X1 [Erythranthe guttata]